MASSNRHPFALLGAAASLITVLGFLGVHGWTDKTTEAADTSTTTTTSARYQPAPSSTPCSCATPTPVTCTVEDRLGDGQAAETVRIAIDGRSYGLAIGPGHTRDSLLMRFASAGQHEYAAVVNTVNSDGSTQRGTGSGYFSCAGGETLSLAGDYSTDPVSITLER